MNEINLLKKTALKMRKFIRKTFYVFIIGRSGNFIRKIIYLTNKLLYFGQQSKKSWSERFVFLFVVGFTSVAYRANKFCSRVLPAGLLHPSLVNRRHHCIKFLYFFLYPIGFSFLFMFDSPYHWVTMHLNTLNSWKLKNYLVNLLFFDP